MLNCRFVYVIIGLAVLAFVILGACDRAEPTRHMSGEAFVQMVTGSLPANHVIMENIVVDDMVNFDGARVKHAVYFNNTVFKGKVRFRNVHFEQPIDFGNATFWDWVWFDYATFEDSVSFSNSRFEAFVGFQSATFGGTVHFGQSLFHTSVGFHSATFEDSVFLDTALFQKAVYFLGTTIPMLDIGCATFSQGADADADDSVLNSILVSVNVYEGSEPRSLATITLGTGLKTADDFYSALIDTGCAVGTAYYLLQKPAFTVAKQEIEVELVVLTTGDLTGSKRGGTNEEVFEGAARLGLDVCPAEVGPQLRLQYLDHQPFGKELIIGMNPIRMGPNADSILDNDPLWVFSLECVEHFDYVPRLGTIPASPYIHYSANRLWVFRRPE